MKYEIWQNVYLTMMFYEPGPGITCINRYFAINYILQNFPKL